MAKFKLQPEPTFKAPVPIPVPGGEPAEIVCEFRHRTRSEVKEFIGKNPEDGDYLMWMLVGWDLDDEFGRPNVDFLLQHHQGAAAAISTVYLSELIKGRLGN